MTAPGCSRAADPVHRHPLPLPDERPDAVTDELIVTATPTPASSWRPHTGSCRCFGVQFHPERCSPRAATGCSRTSCGCGDDGAVGAVGRPQPARAPLTRRDETDRRRSGSRCLTRRPAEASWSSVRRRPAGHGLGLRDGRGRRWPVGAVATSTLISLPASTRRPPSPGDGGPGGLCDSTSTRSG